MLSAVVVVLCFIYYCTAIGVSFCAYREWKAMAHDDLISQGAVPELDPNSVRANEQPASRFGGKGVRIGGAT